MPKLITFKTSLFDPATEPDNPVNPLHGASEKLCGRGKMRDDDPALGALLAALRKEPAFSAVDCEE